MEVAKFYKQGDIVYIVDLEISKKGNRINRKIFIEARCKEVAQYSYKFEILKVYSGTSYKVGELIYVATGSRKYITPYREIFQTYEDAKEYWNSVIQDNIDKVTSVYQESIKILNKELL